MGFNPLLSGSVFLTTVRGSEIPYCRAVVGFNPLLSGSVFLTDSSSRDLHR